MQTQKNQRFLKPLRAGVALLCLLGSQSQLTAQDLAVGDSISSIALETIRVEAFQHRLSPLDFPSAIAVIQAKQLREMQSQPIDYALNQVAGVYMQSGSLNTNRLTIRGIGSRSPYATNKIRAYLGEIPLTNGSGETTIEDLDLSFINQLEVVKGPASGYYGSGLGGTLLFEADPINTNEFQLSGSLASFDRKDLKGHIKLNNGNWRSALYLAQLNAQGYRDNNQTERTNLSYLGAYDLDQHHFKLTFIQTDLKAYIPSSLNWDDFQNHPQSAAANWAAVRGYEDYQKQLGGISVQSDWSENLNSRISLFGQRKNETEIRPFNTLEGDSYYWGFRAVLNRDFRTAQSIIHLSLGNESFFEHYNWATFDPDDSWIFLSDNQEKRQYTNFFGQLNWRRNRWNISSGININWTSYDYKDRYFENDDQSATRHFSPILSPRLAVNYAWLKSTNIYASVSHGFSPPSLEESLMPDGERNNTIKPEKAWNYEIGFRGDLGARINFDVSAYYMLVSDLLVARRTAEDAYMGINAGKTQHPGVELSLTYQWLHTQNLNGQLRFSGDYSPHQFKDFVDDDLEYSGNELTGNPKTRFNIFAETMYRRAFKLLVHFHHTGEMPLRDDNQIYTDAFQLLDLQLSYTKNLGPLQLVISGAAFNLGDEHYAAMVLINASSFGGQEPRYYYPGMPRNYSGRLSLNYSF